MLIAAFIAASAGSARAETFPDSFWGMNSKYEAALNSGNYNDIITYGNQIINLFKDRPESQQKRDILVSRYNETGKAYAAIGDYTKSAETFKKLYDYVEPLGDDYYDYIRASKEKYMQYMPEMTIYTDNGKPASYGAKNEKDNGVLFGLCSTSETRNALENESMVLVYQELGQSLLPYNVNVIRNAAAKGKAIELALNCPKEAEDIKNIEKLTPYLEEISDMIGTYSLTPFYLRFGAEFDVWTNLTDGESYKKAFRYVSDYFRRRNPNVALVWSPNQVSGWNIDIDDYYPGDEYVDWVGMSSYAQRYFLGDKNQTADNEIIFKTGLNSNPVITVREIVEKYGDRKPVMISESGCGHRLVKSGEDTSAFALTRLRQYYSYLPMVYPQIKLIAYFDQYIDGASEKNDYRLTTNSELRGEFLRLSKGERFIQDSYENSSSMCYRKVADGTWFGGAFLLSCYAHRYAADTRKVTYFIDGKYVGMSEEIPFSTYVNASAYTGKHRLKAVAEFSDGTAMTTEHEVNFMGAPDDITVEISGDEVSFDQKPVIYNDRTMVPMRKIFEELNAEVDWDGDTRTVTGRRGDRTVRVSVGSAKMYVNKKQILLDTAPIVLADRTLVPVRAVAEGLGCEVGWDGGKYLVSVTPRVFTWSEWALRLPDEVDDDLFYIEQKTEYRTRSRTRDKEYYTLSSQIASDNYVRTDTTYGKWSEWQDSYIRETNDLEVDTRTVSNPVQYEYYHYCTGYRDDEGVSYKTSSYSVSELSEYHYLGMFDAALGAAEDGDGYVYYEDGELYRCPNGCDRWYVIEHGGSYEQYRSRPIYREYVYWEWGNWSDWTGWSDWQEGSAPYRYYNAYDDEQYDNEERILFRYKEK